MRYMLLMHGNESGWDTLSEAERAARYERYGKLQHEMEEHGHYVAGDELESAPAPAATLVHVRDGETIVSDGPFRGDEGAVRGGHFTVECDLETAIGYARKIPAAEGGTIEVRPIFESP